MTRALSPVTLVLVCWGLTGLGAALTLGSLDTLPLVQTFMTREGIATTAFTGMGVFWIIVGLLTYVVADMAARITRPRPRAAQTYLDPVRAAHLTFAANMILLGVTALWIMTAAAKAGGLLNLVATAYLDSLTTRDLLLENKLFTGMRLFYAALPATACLAAALLATRTLPRRARHLMQATLLCNIAALFVLPIVMSQRLLLLQLLLSAYLVACIVRGRVFGLHWIAIGIALFLGLWIAREAITNPIIQASAVDIATQKLAYYLVNDMFNAFAPLGVPINHTYGGLTLEGVMFLTFTDSYFAQALAPRMDALDPVLGGGEFPLFTAAYVDYGPFGGAVFIALCAVAFRRIFARARRSIGWAVIYAQIGAALLFSSHSVYFTHQNFYFSAAVVALIIAASMKRPVVIASPPPPVIMFRTRRRVVRAHAPLPDSIMRHMVIFTTCRAKPGPFRTRRKVRRTDPRTPHRRIYEPA